MPVLTASNGRMLPMLPAPRPVDDHWKCQKSGDCCTKIAEVVMTKEEAAELVHHAPPTVTMKFRDQGDGFVAMKAEPCPLFIFKRCIVYEHRPYNCRRFVCLRPDVKAEPFEPSGANMMDRVKTNRKALRIAADEQRRAQRWARKHGWKVDSEETVPAAPAPAPAVPSAIILTDG